LKKKYDKAIVVEGNYRFGPGQGRFTVDLDGAVALSLPGQPGRRPSVRDVTR